MNKELEIEILPSSYQKGEGEEYNEDSEKYEIDNEENNQKRSFDCRPLQSLQNSEDSNADKYAEKNKGDNIHYPISIERTEKNNSDQNRSETKEDNKDPIQEGDNPIPTTLKNSSRSKIKWWSYFFQILFSIF